MRHRKAGVKLNRTTSHRQAMFRNMVTSLFKYDRIKTTDAKAKELRRWADRIITLAKKGDLNARRQALSIVREKDVVHKLFDEVQKRFGKVNGGYTRITKLGFRPGDKASVSLIELITVAEAKPKKKKAAPKKAAAVATAAKAKEAPAEKSPEATEDKADDAVEAAPEAEESAPEAAAAPEAEEAAPEAEAEAEAPAEKESKDKE